MMGTLGKTLFTAGLLIAAAGLVLLAADRIPWLGKLPGDITIQGKHGRIVAPLTTCLLLSVVASLVLWVISLLRK